MRNLSVLMVLVFFMCFACFAQENAVPDGNVSGEQNDTSKVRVEEDTESFSGTVNFISSGSFMRGASPQINVRDSVGFESIFVVDKDTRIIGKDGSTISINWITKGDKVALEYITDEHVVKRARYIKIVPGW